ncbi:zinc ABC transporter substrate-binding protein [Polycladidibacter stylochi]|uniref:zinc ABC transporter substrate-binding protein n=1 Tax=Polycladidibacter stylochi TaxID=1807766 RepID=UPI00082DBE57|nr:zinc ABC transporter substrate-binding protein [Pseudovibrio stylochi]
MTYYRFPKSASFKKNVSKLLLATSLLTASFASHAKADEAPQIVVSIKPVHALVASVTKGVTTPKLIVTGAGSPHTYSLKPSQARDLQNADIVFWVGPQLETFLEKPLHSLAENASVTELSEAQGMEILSRRTGDGFEKHSHGAHEEHDEHAEHEHEQEGHKEHADHNDHKDHDHDEAHDKHEGEHHEEHEKHADHEKHEEGHGEHEDHDGHAHHGNADPHLWLDPHNAIAMLKAISAKLEKEDPIHAESYKQNTKDAIAKLNKLDEKIKHRLEPYQNKGFIVFHDAYQYFEKHYGLHASGSMTLNPQVTPGAKQMREISQRLDGKNISCAFYEPQFNPKTIKVLAQEQHTKLEKIDPLGAELTPGPDMYLQLIEGVANSMEKCLK